MATDFFIKITGATAGEATAKGVEGYSSISSLNFGVHTDATFQSGTTGHSSGKSHLSHITITKDVDASSKDLFKYAASGKHFTDAIIIARETTGSATPEIYYQLDLTDVFVQGVTVGGVTGGGKLAETVEIAVGKIKTTYFKQDNTSGLLTNTGSTIWDLVTNSVS